MTTIPHEPTPVARLWVTRFLVPEMWATLAIVVIWLSVLFASIYAPSIDTTSAGGDHMTLPAALPLALFAFLATWAVARYGFGHDRETER